MVETAAASTATVAATAEQPDAGPVQAAAPTINTRVVAPQTVDQHPVEPGKVVEAAVAGLPKIENTEVAAEAAKKAVAAEAKVNEEMAAAAKAAIDGKTDSRKALQTIAEMAKSVTGQTEAQHQEKMAQLHKRVEKMKISNNPSEKALGYDFDIALAQYEQVDMQAQINRIGMQIKDPRNQEHVSRLEKHRAELQAKLEGTTTDDDGEVVESPSKKIERLRDEKAKDDAIKNLPNVIDGIGARLEISSADFQNNPLGGILNKIGERTASNKETKGFLKFLGEKSFTKEEQKEIFRIGDMLNGRKSTVEKAVDAFERFFSLSMLLNLLFLYIASQEKRGGGGGGG